MKIQKVEIKGLFGKKDIEWALNPQVNVLVGENGSGKSTILSVIHGFLTQEISDHTEETILSASIYFVNGQIDLKIKEEIETNKFLTEMLNSGGNTEKITNMHPELFRNLLTTLKKNNTFYASNYSANGDIADKIYRKDKHFYIDLIEANISNVNANQKIELRTRSTKNTIDIEIQDTLDELKKVKDKEVIKKLINSLNLFFNQIGKKVSSEDNKFIYTDIELEKPLNYSQLSSGERQLIYILLRVALSNKDKNKTAIILMDEPEISLHVNWQADFIKQLTLLNPDAQFIIVTHSPAIIMNGWNDIYVNMDEITK